ncbi:bacterial transcriptional activator domain-containing protein [Thermophilibacter provencensis]|uniref:Bacterial transcriptional activator domain-containing protein n=1 Tax=Thermophilibacter provencensis TaxID=1852386 RepID=A0ABT7V292_9ACTN|nr:bacterial transcriptional activator domain-containing protein [Thermophilibacter provencensis]MDM8270727.1 bacterial transcriptional activator domain-containing protein [Thermophilibacter provencensis]
MSDDSHVKNEMKLFASPTALFEASSRGEQLLLAICAEPGMGRHDLVGEIVSEAQRRSFVIHSRQLRSSGPNKAVRTLSRLARDVIKPDARTLLVLENVPSFDEHEVSRFVTALGKAMLPGVSVVLTLSPDARQLLEELPEYRVIWTSDLLALGYAEISRSRYPQELRSLTRGIPSLLRSLGDARLAGCTPGAPPQAYFDALGSLVEQTVRRGLSDEELEVRLAMLLLGSGTTDDVQRVVGRSPDEMIAVLCSEAPVLGISSGLDRFSCLGSDAHLASMATVPRLSSACLEHSEVLARSARLLMSRGDYSRAAILCKMVPADGMLRMVVERGAEFIDVSEIALVRRSVSRERLLGECPPSVLESLELAMDAVSSRRFDAEGAARLATLSGVDAAALMFVEARRLLRGPWTRGIELSEDVSPLVYRLHLHREAFVLMADGRPDDAMRLLVAHPRGASERTLSGALLELDLEVAQLLMGDAGEGATSDEEPSRLGAPELSGLAPYLSLSSVIRETLEGSPRASTDAEALAASAERQGDSLVLVVALLAGCICDLRGKTLARAAVRSQLAADRAVAEGLVYLGRVARLLRAVAGFMLGERVSYECLEGGHDGLSRVCSVVLSAMALDEGDLTTEELETAAPRNELWLLGVLAYGMGTFSPLLRRCLPSSWKRALSGMAAGPARGRGTGSECSPSSALARGLGSPLPEESKIPIDVTLLGGCAVYVRGVRIPDWKLERRNAKALLEYLVLQRGGSAKRFQLVDQVWPGKDYVTGFNKAYQATSALRAAIAEIEPGLDPFVTSRSSREISLDMGLVRCDVDLFRAFAREASDASDPMRALSMARQAESLYAGDLYVPSDDSTGLVTKLRDELRELYADAMVAGAEAALEMGQERTAARLASNALAANELREDAILTLVRALKAGGRSLEAERHFRHHCARLRRLGASGPSERLLGEMGLE